MSNGSSAGSTQTPKPDDINAMTAEGNKCEAAYEAGYEKGYKHGFKAGCASDEKACRKNEYRKGYIDGYNTAHEEIKSKKRIGMKPETKRKRSEPKETEE
jgi:hypothetical protein